MQMQWKHQICAPELLDGMASPFPEEALRAMQDAIPLYETLPSSDAKYSAHTSLPSAGCSAWMGNVADVDAASTGLLCLGVLAALVHADDLEGPILGRRRRLGRLE